MKKINSLLFLLFFISVFGLSANAQAITTASWKVLRYDINASVSQNDRSLNVSATVSAINIGNAAGTTMTLRLSPQAEVKSAKTTDSDAIFRTRNESLGGLQTVVVNIPSTAINSTVSVTLDYRFPVSANTAHATISPLGSQFLPLYSDDPKSVWYPTPTNPYWPRGWDTAPFRLTVTTNGEQVISSGNSNGNIYTQSLNAQPFFVTGNWDVIEGTGDAKGISVYMAKGASADEKKQAEALIKLTNSAKNFYVSMLGQMPDVPIRLVGTSRGAGFNDSGTILLNDAVFRRGKIDSSTTLLIAEALPRLWIGGTSMIRGEGYGTLREGLPRFLALLFIEKQYGNDIANLERRRGRLAHAGVAKTDGPASQTTLGDKNYFSVAANKSTMIWRYVDKTLGHDTFISTLRSQLQKSANDPNGFNLASFRQAIIEAGSSNLKGVLDQMFDQPTDLDLMVGLPQQKADNWVSALRNLGSTDATVNIVATTQNGEKITVQSTIPARSFSEAVFKSTSPVVHVEIDPEKLYPQIDYSNDIAPRPKVGDTVLFDIKGLFNKQDYTQAEMLARQAIQRHPFDDDLKALLGRILLAQNKYDDAEKEFTAVLNSAMPTALNQSWANEGLGEIRLRRNQNSEAARYFTAAIRADGEYGATLAARSGRIKAESGSPPAIDDSAKSFIDLIDKTIAGDRKSDLNNLVVTGEMDKFVKGIIGSQPSVWQTKILRTEAIDQMRLAVDVSINIKTLNGIEQTGTAVYTLARVSNSWKLLSIDYFEVR